MVLITWEYNTYTNNSYGTIGKGYEIFDDSIDSDFLRKFVKSLEDGDLGSEPKKITLTGVFKV